MFYAVIACVVAFLFAIWHFSENRADEESLRHGGRRENRWGGLAAGEIDENGEDEEDEDDFDESDPRKQNVSILNLILPIASIMAALIATGLDCLTWHLGLRQFSRGMLLIFQGIMTVAEYMQCYRRRRFLDMMDMVIILMLGYSIQEVMYTMGMEAFRRVCVQLPFPFATLLLGI